MLKFGADGLELEIGFWISDPENGRANVVSDANRVIWRALKANKIQVPFAQREVRIVQTAVPAAVAAGEAAANSGMPGSQ